jgi:hypothetical protein
MRRLRSLRYGEQGDRRRGWSFVAKSLRLPHLHGGHKAIAATAYRLDELGCMPCIADGSACHPNAALQRIIADKLPRPQALEQLLLGDYAVAMLHKIGKHVEYLGFQMDELPRSAQFVELCVERILPKGTDHPHRSHP